MGCHVGTLRMRPSSPYTGTYVGAFGPRINGPESDVATDSNPKNLSEGKSGTHL